MSLEPGELVGSYQIVESIGAGGMGEVYCAFDPRLRREVAIKLLPAHFYADGARRRRLEQEARAAGALFRDDYWRGGIGVGYPITERTSVSASLATAIAGTNSHYGYFYNVGVSWTFGSKC